MPSSFTIRALKILSIAGLVINIGVVLMLLLIVLFWRDAAEHTWVSLWFVFAVGIPMFGALFGILNVREHLKNIEASLAKRA
ncbi:MAG: hypothetical protein ACT4P2_07925 [Pseudomonadota bacterium]